MTRIGIGNQGRGGGGECTAAVLSSVLYVSKGVSPRLPSPHPTHHINTNNSEVTTNISNDNWMVRPLPLLSLLMENRPIKLRAIVNSIRALGRGEGRRLSRVHLKVTIGR